MKNILINALGIQDSGGITVLKKMLLECVVKVKYRHYIFVYEHSNIDNLISKFKYYETITFIKIENRGIIHRLYVENVYFTTFVKETSISLIYNFSGSNQFTTKIPSLVKVQNLMFYSKRLDEVYKKSNLLTLWIKQIWLKRVMFLSMLKQSSYIEIQSEHVKNALEDFINIRDKTFYLKNDFSSDKQDFKTPKSYDLSKKLTFLYIVGPHFSFPHKNIQDFVQAMSNLKKAGKDFEIKITLTYEELNSSPLWDSSLNENTIFIGYLKDKDKIQKLFQDNTVLISTSIVETLGLHVIEATQNGILSIAPDELYSKSVYGEELLKYKLFDIEMLKLTLSNIYTMTENEIQTKIQNIQTYMINNEADKFHNVLSIFDKILEENNNV